ncbi:MAG: magnesium transporter [Lachnospiraceae bacterium]|nr:magnesium transporter [Lachnospiraceae bacterium]
MNATNKTYIQQKNLQSVQRPDYKMEIIEILRSNLIPKIKRERILAYHEKDIASTFTLLSEEERHRLYLILDTEDLANILEHSEHPETYISELGIRKKIDIMLQFEITTTIECFRRMEKGERTAILEMMNDEARREIIFLNSFDKEEIGSRMSTNYILLHSGLSIREAMHSLVEQAAEHDNISTIYVVDHDKAFIGAIDLKKLIIAREGTKLNAITMTSYPYVYANERIEDCISRMVDYSEDSIPVLDSKNKLCGVITSQEIMQLVDEELGDDYAKLAGLLSEEDLHEPLKKSIQKRLPWLVILLGLGLFVSGIVGMFENVVAHLPLIIAFQSLILDMAGNTGTQSLAVTIRVLMDEHINGRQKRHLIAKEANIGLINGIILGLLSFLLIGLYLIFIKGQPAITAFVVSFCTGTALLAAMFLASVSGTTVPLVFKKLHIDPAVASGPLITTINDLVAVVIYYGLTWILLIHILHL